MPASKDDYTEQEKSDAANGLDVEYWRSLKRGDHLKRDFLKGAYRPHAIRKGEA